MITFGTDPEFMIQNADGQIVSAIGRIPGNREEKHKIGKYTFYPDNVLAEFTTPPAKTNEDAVAKIRGGIVHLCNMLKEHDCKPLIRASYTYPESELTHPDARKAGCMPEACVYTLATAESPEKVFLKSGFRSAGGHVHMGSKFLKTDKYGSFGVVRMLDLFLGVMSVWLDKDPTSKARKEIYGQAGRFRLPPHGCEYRSLGNYWLQSPQLVSWVFDVCDFIENFVKENKHEQWWKINVDVLEDDDSWNDENFNVADHHICFGYDKDHLRMAINNMNKRTSRRYLPLIEKSLPKKIWKTFSKLADKKFDFEKEWNLK